MNNDKKNNICYECKKEADYLIWFNEGLERNIGICIKCVEKEMSSEEFAELEQHVKETLENETI